MPASMILGDLEALNASAAMPWMTGKRLSQADVITLVCRGFARDAKPELTEAIRAPKLDEVAARAGVMPEFPQTAPNA